MKYKIIPVETIKNLIEFLDEIQFDAAKNQTPDDLHKINFCNWMINELLNGHEGVDTDDEKEKRRNMVDEYFIDWELPEDMSDDEFEKLVNQFDSFLKGWDKEYNKKNPKKSFKKNKKNIEDEIIFRPDIEDISEYLSLDEIKEYLLDDPDLTTEEAFELYYDEHERVQKQKEIKSAKSLNKILKDLGINPTEKN
tara:strand:+ start:275 stop:859 length:585 start_codon:yes stop_codon:yes gene_type:complete